MATQLILHKYDKGVKIVNQGDPADSFYIIKSGKVRTLENGKEVCKLKTGDCFGENALLSDEGLRRNTV
jgi:cGMP-dependent protein kinase